MGFSCDAHSRNRLTPSGDGRSTRCKVTDLTVTRWSEHNDGKTINHRTTAPTLSQPAAGCDSLKPDVGLMR